VQSGPHHAADVARLVRMNASRAQLAFAMLDSVSSLAISPISEQLRRRIMYSAVLAVNDVNEGPLRPLADAICEACQRRLRCQAVVCAQTTAQRTTDDGAAARTRTPGPRGVCCEAGPGVCRRRGGSGD
jgi:hypothetical protein